MNKYATFMFDLKEWIPAFAGMTTCPEAGITTECRLSLSVIPVKTGIQDVAGTKSYNILQLAIESI